MAVFTGHTQDNRSAVPYYIPRIASVQKTQKYQAPAGQYAADGPVPQIWVDRIIQSLPWSAYEVPERLRSLRCSPNWSFCMIYHLLHRGFRHARHTNGSLPLASGGRLSVRQIQRSSRRNKDVGRSLIVRVNVTRMSRSSSLHWALCTVNSTKCGMQNTVPSRAQALPVAEWRFKVTGSSLA